MPTVLHFLGVLHGALVHGESQLALQAQGQKGFAFWLWLWLVSDTWLYGPEPELRSTNRRWWEPMEAKRAVPSIWCQALPNLCIGEWGRTSLRSAGALCSIIPVCPSVGHAHCSCQIKHRGSYLSTMALWPWRFLCWLLIHLTSLCW